MNAYPIIMAAMGVSLIMTMAILLIGSRGPWNSFWALFVILFLALWVTGIYVTPFGPVYLGVAWVPLMMAGVVYAVILLFAAPKRGNQANKKRTP
ncbi:MAG: hypothetical protein QM762_25570 [Chryseolinea sp.]